MTAQAPNPFPYEDAEYEITNRPPVRRPPDYQPGDPIARAVLTAWLALAVVFLMAVVTRSHYTPHIILGCIAAGIATAAAGALAYRVTDRKAGQ